MPSLEGKWAAPLLSGGVPPESTCIQNPQFAIYPGVEDATYEIEVVRYNPESKFRMALWVMKGEKVDTRMTDFVGMVDKSTLSSSDRRMLSLKLPPRKGGLPYVAFTAPQDKGIEGSFTISVTSKEDPGVQFVSLNETVGRDPGAAADLGSATQDGIGAEKLQSLNPTSGTAVPPMVRSQTTFNGQPPDNKPVIETIGQGLSRKAEDDAKRALETALAAAASTADGKFVDDDFPPDDTSLGAPAASLGVAKWLRPEEIEPGFKFDLQSAEKIALKLGSLDDEWLVGALNVVGGTPGVASRLFVDDTHAAEGVYVVRLWAEDSTSDDDWAVITVDDRLPCDDEGQPAFARGAREGALWAAIVEKAVAKRFGSYSKLATTTTPASTGGGVPMDGDESTLRGLELVTGGKARPLDMPPAGAASADALDALWQTLQECGSTDQAVCARCDASSARAAEASQLGISPDRTYCVLVSAGTKYGRLMKLRGFAGESEWLGKWSDDDKAWTNDLKQALDYRRDDQDGTFWMDFADFVKHFSAAFATRVADDRWTSLTVKSRWMDTTAGGGPGFASFRENYQWRLTLPRAMQITMEISLPDGRFAPATTPPMGLMVVRSDPPPDERRRKLHVRDRSEVVYEIEPRLARRVHASVRLDATPAGGPYLLIPYLAMPGAESKFSLKLLVDDLDDDGKPDLTLEPVSAADDWHTKRVTSSYATAKSAPNAHGFSQNERVGFTLAAGAAEARVRVCLETIGATADRRDAEGTQSSADYPAIGLVLLPSFGSGAPIERLPQNAIEVGPAAKDGIWLEATLPTGSTPHVLVPYLGPGQPPLTLRYNLTIYADTPIGDVGSAPAKAMPTSVGAWPCEACSVADGGHGPTCPFRILVEKMQKMEALLDERCVFLDELLAQGVNGTWGK